MTLTKLTVKKLLGKEKLAFLVGAGCSIDPPSNLPDGRTMIEAIVKFACARSEIDKILKLKGLRFEQLVEHFRDYVDEELQCIEYYGQCKTPNSQHVFLADMIMRGQFVMTTNFDFLIENALLAYGIPKKEIVPVITESDFMQFDDPRQLFKKGKKAVYKIHGSTENMITGENTKKSLVVLEIEKYEHALSNLENILKRLRRDIRELQTKIDGIGNPEEEIPQKEGEIEFSLMNQELLNSVFTEDLFKHSVRNEACS